MRQAPGDGGDSGKRRSDCTEAFRTQCRQLPLSRQPDQPLQSARQREAWAVHHTDCRAAKIKEKRHHFR